MSVKISSMFDFCSVDVSVILRVMCELNIGMTHCSMPTGNGLIGYVSSIRNHETSPLIKPL
jgi:hypothetical protein